MHMYKVIILLVLFFLVAVFTFQNTAAAEVTFLFWSINMSVSLMLLAALFIGVILGLLIALVNLRRKNKKVPDNEYTEL